MGPSGNGRKRHETGLPTPTWKHETLRSMLSVAAVFAPLASIFAIMGRPPPRPVIDSVVVLAVGFAMPVLRLVPLFSFGARAASTMAVIYGGAVFVLARMGLAPGSSLLFVLASTFGAIFYGRVVGIATVLFGGLAFLVIGGLAAHGTIPTPPAMFDPHSFRNWFRVGSVFALIGMVITTIISFVIGRAEAGARDLNVAYQRLGLLHLRLESSKEEERRFLAHELHDEFGQLLTALKLRIQLGAREGGSGAEPDTLAVIDDLIARVRRMSGNLRPPLLDEVGLVPALRAHLDAQAALSGVTMTLEAAETPEGTPRLADDVEITCFRIIQEAVTNALRHAAPRELRVRLDRSAERVALRVSDDGRGFDVDVRLEVAAATGHLGVLGMRERVRELGGGFHLRSRPGAGTTIDVELPLVPAGRVAAAAVPS